MKKIKMGIQISTVLTKIKEMGIYETFKKLSELGFYYVEMSQVDMTEENLAELEKACNDFGMEVVAWGCWLSPNPNIKNIFNLGDECDKLIKLCQKTGCKFLRLGGIEAAQTYESSVDFAQKCNKAIEKLEKSGIELYAHNHHFEFAKFDGEFMLDVIAENAPKLGLEIDVHWVQRGGVDPVGYIKKYPQRLKIFHLKDYKIATREELKNDPQYNPDKPFDMGDLVRHAVVGEGSLDFPKIIETALELGTEAFFIEQDAMYGEDVFDCISRSKKYLEKIGYGECFKK